MMVAAERACDIGRASNAVTRRAERRGIHGNRPPRMFRQQAEDSRAFKIAARDRAIAVMLTGMGADGAEAMLQLSAAGAYTIAQDESSCVVFGMPRQAIAIGAVREVLPLGQMARRLIELSGV